jgi:2-amino-4-hydroxy-6-hydroxymethyldihydropteridine diphosphokinase
LTPSGEAAMNTVSLSIGSNQNPEHYIVRALNALQQRFLKLRISSVYESVAIGYAGDNFLNLAVVLDTAESLASLAAFLKQLEDDNGRKRGQSRFSSRTLDVDILTYGDLEGVHEGILLPRPEVTQNAYVLCPLAEVGGQLVNPQCQLSYADLWEQYDKGHQKLWPIDFFWGEQRISAAAPRTPA